MISISPLRKFMKCSYIAERQTLGNFIILRRSANAHKRRPVVAEYGVSYKFAANVLNCFFVLNFPYLSTILSIVHCLTTPPPVFSIVLLAIIFSFRKKREYMWRICKKGGVGRCRMQQKTLSQRETVIILWGIEKYSYS